MRMGSFNKPIKDYIMEKECALCGGLVFTENKNRKHMIIKKCGWAGKKQVDHMCDRWHKKEMGDTGENMNKQK